VIEAHGNVDIARPVEEVFDYLADARNEPAWLPGAERVEKLTDGPVGLGTRFRGRYARAGEVELELVAYERPARVTFRASSRIVEFDDAVELSARGDATELRAVMLARPRGVMRLFEPLMARTMRRQFAANWAFLRDRLEADGDVRAPTLNTG
jgi:uncharacterized protein YndB with AHSA1/START domain